MDTKTIAHKGLEGACTLFLKDLNALPEEAFTKSFGPVTRTVADIVYEVNLVNDHVGMVIRGEEPFEWPGGDWIKAPADLQSKEDVIKAFEQSSEKIIATIAAFSSEELEALFDGEGKETTRFERCRFMTIHIWYHLGQLNFIQTLLGDDGWHWK